MTEEERKLETVKRWMHCYNTDVRNMIHECYAENAEVHDMGYMVMKDHPRFLAVEEAVLRVAPNRQVRVERTFAKDNVVVVEATLFGKDKDTGEAWEMPWCAVLTFKDGKIITDRTYMDHLKRQTVFPFQRHKKA